MHGEPGRVSLLGRAGEPGHKHRLELKGGRAVHNFRPHAVSRCHAAIVSSFHCHGTSDPIRPNAGSSPKREPEHFNPLHSEHHNGRSCAQLSRSSPGRRNAARVLYTFARGGRGPCLSNSPPDFSQLPLCASCPRGLVDCPNGCRMR